MSTPWLHLSFPCNVQAQNEYAGSLIIIITVVILTGMVSMYTDCCTSEPIEFIIFLIFLQNTSLVGEDIRIEQPYSPEKKSL